MARYEVKTFRDRIESKEFGNEPTNKLEANLIDILMEPLKNDISEKTKENKQAVISSIDTLKKSLYDTWPTLKKHMLTESHITSLKDQITRALRKMHQSGWDDMEDDQYLSEGVHAEPTVEGLESSLEKYKKDEKTERANVESEAHQWKDKENQIIESVFKMYKDVWQEKEKLDNKKDLDDLYNEIKEANRAMNQMYLEYDSLLTQTQEKLEINASPYHYHSWKGWAEYFYILRVLMNISFMLHNALNKFYLEHYPDWKLTVGVHTDEKFKNLFKGFGKKKGGRTRKIRKNKRKNKRKSKKYRKQKFLKVNHKNRQNSRKKQKFRRLV